MRELVFLLEERSAKALLDSLLPRFLSTEIHTRLIPFEGKQDLEKNIERRIRAYQNPHARFIILRDQDSHPDCKNLKGTLSEYCKKSGRAQHCLVRIACQELEAFYLADLDAVEKALTLNRLASRQGARKFRDPDKLGSPSRELRSLTKNRYQKVSGSREIGKHLDIENRRSPSFQNLIAAIRRMEGELKTLVF
ncbi:MAG: hypothetical protein CVV12_02125 [Gammaproteobacteria bacterium HGW-Gammaproteobacteria-2]|jgi:hypothetical protein|nr:MAG: hypothetical protein CVV12_02125 [Gammaproteobacteria bacterium HGW-Gammaproteobacteria-2]